MCRNARRVGSGARNVREGCPLDMPWTGAEPAVAAAAEAPGIEGGPSAKALLEHAWVDRDVAWLEFNRRVLHEALDPRTPLLERLKFLAIFSSNLDEFYMKRIGLLRSRARAERKDPRPVQAGDARALLAQLRAAVVEMLEVRCACLATELLPELRQRNILLVAWDDLTPGQQEDAALYFERNVSPALTPLGFDPAHPFPFMSNLSTSWVYHVRAHDGDETVPVRVKIPNTLPQWIPVTAEVSEGERRFLGLSDLIRANAERLFPGMQIVDATLFRIVRNADIEVDDEESESLRDSVAQSLRQRMFEPVVRVDIAEGANEAVVAMLRDRFDLSDDDFYRYPGLLDYGGLFQIASLDIPELRDAPWRPLPHARLSEGADIFSAIQTSDVLLHHPYDCFERSVEHFIRRAAEDPDTIAIKMTVYRVGDDTPFVRSLIRAAELGKQVACVIELKARFDEARNLVWARELEKVGAHVTYGLLGLKTHTKVALVVRKEGHGLRCYAHVGTGNYHVKTARLYTDVGLLTCEPDITGDVVKLFHYLTGRSAAPGFAKLLVAPVNMRDRFLALVEREIANCRAGKPARIVLKMNQVEDVEMCRALVAASRAGVRVDLVVRGFCCLLPDLPGWTQNIRVRSIIGRFLEHSRILYFANGSEDVLDGTYYIGSADWMYRNLSRRVEAAAPIEDRALRERLWEILQIALDDERQAWVMEPSGKYRQLQPAEEAHGAARTGSHPYTMDAALRRWGAVC